MSDPNQRDYREIDASRRPTNEESGVRRAAGGIGTGSSAVDPVELERARAGFPSRDDEQGTPTLSPMDRVAMAGSGDLLEVPDEITASEAHRERLSR